MYVYPMWGHVPCMCTLCDDYSLLLAGSPSDFLLGFCVMVWRSGSESSKAGWGVSSQQVVLLSYAWVGSTDLTVARSPIEGQGIPLKGRA